MKYAWQLNFSQERTIAQSKFKEAAISILEVRQISKRFAGVQALNSVSLELHPGEIHGLMGENGAGKSTLVKILTGTYLADEGQIFWKGDLRQNNFPGTILDLGLSVVYQESSIIPELTVGENIFLGRLPQRNGIVNWKVLWKKCAEALSHIDIDLDPKLPAAQLSPVERRMIEIAKAISTDAELIILDEPTTALSIIETQLLFDQILKLKDQGIAFLYISHFLEEVFHLSNKITVLRDGKLINTLITKETTPEKVVSEIAGHKIDAGQRSKKVVKDKVLIEIKGFSSDRAFKNISFSISRGEILGLAGAIGSGRTRLVRSIFGLEKIDSGEIHISKILTLFRNPSEAIQAGIAFLTKSRLTDGLIMEAPIVHNISMPILKLLSPFGIMKRKKEMSITRGYIDQLRIKAQSLFQNVAHLSGGNQQKVVLAKWLAAAPKIFILDEPTQGVDVAAKAEIYNILERLSEKGVTLLVSSSEPEELERLCSRVLVLRRGEIVEELRGADVNRELIIKTVTAGSKNRSSA